MKISIFLAPAALVFSVFFTNTHAQVVRDYWPTVSWQSRTLQDANMEPAIIQQLIDDINNGNFGTIHSLLVIKDGYMVTEEYFNGSSVNDVHELQSSTKSMASALVGIALDQGHVSSTDKVVDIFNQYTFQNMGGPSGGMPPAVVPGSTGFQPFTLTFNKDEAATLLLVALVAENTADVGAPGSKIFLDDLHLEFDNNPGVNVLSNGDFESGDHDETFSTFTSSPNVERWHGINAGCTTGIDATTSGAASGVYGLELNPIGFCGASGDSSTRILNQDLADFWAAGATQGTFTGVINLDHLDSSTQVKLTVAGFTGSGGATTLRDDVFIAGGASVTPGDVPSKADITVKDMLTMKHGLFWREWGYSSSAEMDNLLMIGKTKPFGGGGSGIRQSNVDWIQYVLDRPMSTVPGSVFRYSTGVSAVLAAIVEQTTGMDAATFADISLFDPIGVTSDLWWVIDANELIHAGGGLKMTAQDFARFSFLIHNNGYWDGSQLISQAYLNNALAVDSEWIALNSHYGYQFWRTPIDLQSGPTMTVSTHGQGGQYSLSVPELDLLLVSTADNLPEPDQSSSIQMLKDYVIPSVEAGSSTEPPGLASSPNPANGATGVSVNASLTWTSGSGATSHDVYFGTTNPPPFVQNQTGNSYSPGTLQENTTYHWRIDEVNSNGTTTGTAWSFTTGSAPVGQKDYPNADIPLGGTVSGSYVDTQNSDNNYESITEQLSLGSPSARYSYLRHKWTIDVTGGSAVTFYVEAHHDSNSENDDFVFAYSTSSSGTYTDMATVTKTSDDNSVQTFSLPSSLSGTIYIRVEDTDQTSGNQKLDAIHIDEMYILSE